MIQSRFLRIWLLWSTCYMALVTLGPNGLVPVPVWPDISQHLLQARAWLGHDIVEDDLAGETIRVIAVAPRLDVTPYFEHRIEKDPREGGLVSNLAVAVRSPDGTLIPAQDTWTGSAETLLEEELVCHVGFPPGPAFLLLPLLALLRSAVAVQWVGAVLGGLAVAAMDRLLSLWLIDVGSNERTPSNNLLSVLAGAGTLWLWIVPGSGTFLFAQTVGTTALAVGLTLAATGSRVSAGICFGLAITSRPAMIGALPIFLALGLRPTSETRQPASSGSRAFPFLLAKRIGTLTIGPLALGGIALILNHLRFGSPIEFGYRFMVVPPFLRDRILEHGQVSLAHLARNLQYVFVELPAIIRDDAGNLIFPFLVSDPRGMSVLFVTPAFVAVLTALLKWGDRTRKTMLGLAWLSLGLTCLPGLLYYNTGWVQWGGRFLIDAWPMWLLLTAVGLGRLPKRVATALIVASIVSNAWAALLMLFRVWPACCQ